MKVIKSEVLEFVPDRPTILFLDGKVPLTRWKKVRIGGAVYETIFMSGAQEDQIALRGAHDLTGMDIQFI